MAEFSRGIVMYQRIFYDDKVNRMTVRFFTSTMYTLTQLRSLFIHNAAVHAPRKRTEKEIDILAIFFMKRDTE